MFTSFILPFPPSVNTEYKTGRGRRSKGDKVLKWADFARVCLAQQNVLPFIGRAVVILELNTPDNRTRDAANYEKFTIDFLVDMGILSGDSSRYIKGVYPHWNDIKGKEIKVIIVPADKFHYQIF